jgi:hypothetical protein
MERPIAYTSEEGGPWLPYPELADMPHVHAVKLANGAIWDEVNGWRENAPKPKGNK